MWRAKKSFFNGGGLSVCFRQYKARSHCHFLHGYGIWFDVEFGSDSLDDRNWVIDFGSFKRFKETVQQYYDHKMLIADSDPHKQEFIRLHELGIADVRFVSKVSVESFAEELCILLIEDFCMDDIGVQFLQEDYLDRAMLIKKVKVYEHDANSASFSPSPAFIQTEVMRVCARQDIRSIAGFRSNKGVA